MASHQHSSRLHNLVGSAPEYLTEYLRIKTIRETHDIERNLRLAAHCVNIAQSIRSRNLSEQIRVVNNRREEVQRLDDSSLI